MTQQGRRDDWSPWDSPAKRLWKRAKPTKLTSGLIGLSSAAIVSVYAVGYFNTQAAEEQLIEAAPASNVNSVVGAVASATPTVGTTPRTSAGGLQVSPSPTPARTAVPGGATAVSYKDGTYVGTGTSRHGSIQATVVVSGGKIVSADVTSCGTRYPCSKIAALPPKVLATQAAPTSYVSGATESSRAYTTAIKSALAQATVVS